jgi:NTP pyrophosphatase (non-canonical NTP hydrolase)
VDVQELVKKIEKVKEIYQQRTGIKGDADWCLMKIQEELGELTSSYLQMTDRARTKGSSLEEIRKNFEDELADVISMLILFARHNGADIEKCIASKWFAHLEQ